jgi:hypothetical protein
MNREPKRLVADIAKFAVTPRVYHGKLAEEYDGISQYVKVSLSAGSSSVSYKAKVSAGDFATGQKFPVGTPVVLYSYRGQVTVLSLGNKRIGGSNFRLSDPTLIGSQASCASDLSELTEIPTPNGDLESGSTYWSGTGFISIFVGESGRDGNGHNIFGGGGGGTLKYTGGWDYTFRAGITYRFQVWAFEDGPNGGDTMNFGSDAEFAIVSASTIGGSGNWTLLCGTWTPTADTDGANVWFRYNCNVGSNLHLDDLQVFVGGAVSNPNAGTSLDLARKDHTHLTISNRAPESTDDGDAGYPTTTLWFDAVSGETWVSLDDTAGAAIWVPEAVTSHADLSDLTTGDPHTQYQKESEKGVANGYASLGAGGRVPIAQLASGTPDGTKFIRDDGTLAVPPGGGGGGGGSGSASAVRVHRAGALNITSTSTAISWDTEDRDDNGYWNIGNPTQLIAPVDGWYYVGGGIVLQNSNADYLEGALLLDGTTELQRDLDFETSDVIPKMINFSSLVYLTAGQYIELIADAGGTVAVSPGQSCNMWMSLAEVGSGTPVTASYKRTSGNYTSTSTTFVDVDSTNMALTITTGAHRVLIGFVGTVQQSIATDNVMLDVEVDGVRVGGDFGLVSPRPNQIDLRVNGSFAFLTDVLSAGSHTFKLQWRRFGSGTMLMYGDSADSECQFFVIEQSGGGTFLGPAKGWVVDNANPADYPSSPSSMNDEFNGAGLDAKWTWRNQNGASFSNVHDGFGTINADNHSGDRWSFIEQALPVGDWIFEAKVSREALSGGFSGGGLCLIESSSGAFYAFAPYSESGAQTIEVFRWNSPSSWNSTVYRLDQPVSRSFILRIVKVGTTYQFWYGSEFAMILAWSSTIGITPDKIALGINEANSLGGVTKLHVDYFRKI